MKFSLNSLRSLNARYGTTADIAPDGVDALLNRIGSQLGAVEETSLIGAKYEGIIIAKIVHCEDHPNADRLHVCKLDDGGVKLDVERDADGLIQVVCGAANVRAGILVAWLPPGSTVPSSAATEPFVLEARDLRGSISNGMLASPRELALGDNHDGILEIDEAHGPIAAGSEFAQVFGLKDDVVIDIENKMFTHRPDCFGWLGVSRELAGIQNLAFRSPDWYQPQVAIAAPTVANLPLRVENEIPELVSRYMTLVLDEVKVGVSPVWLQVELAKVGMRSINNIVDYTNFFMLQTGQPLHAYDYDKVKALGGSETAMITVRTPRAGESITLLNGKTITPRPEAIVIASGAHLLGIGGVMGGGESEVDASTSRIILECASFDMYSIRRTAMAYGLFTDAVTRFNKGQSPLQNQAVMAKIVTEITTFAGASIASPLIDITTVGDRTSVYPAIQIAVSFINERLGLQLPAAEMQVLLSNVEFNVTYDQAIDLLHVVAPFWRTDIELREDIVEEVGRLYGYDNLPLVLPERTIQPAAKNQLLEFKDTLRLSLAKAGANEVLSYSFVPGSLLDKVTQKRDEAFKLANALSPELQYYRLHALPSLLDKVHLNVKAGYDEFALFEINKGHNLRHKDDDNGVPTEIEFLDFVYASKVKRPGSAFYQARKYLDALAADFDVGLVYGPISEDPHVPVADPYDYTRSAYVTTDSGDFLGMVGELKASVLKALKLPEQTAAFTIGPAQLHDTAAKQISSYQVLSRFPKVQQDICLRVARTLHFQTLASFVTECLTAAKPANSHFSIAALDIYQRADDLDHQQITFRLTISSTERTMTDQEVTVLLDQLTAGAHDRFNAERV
jgi:phenylalanyl-tRNA synthetase beta chain